MFLKSIDILNGLKREILINMTRIMSIFPIFNFDLVKSFNRIKIWSNLTLH